MKDCCEIKKTNDDFTCPRTGTKGSPVEKQLVHLKVLGRYQHLIDENQTYRFCNDPDCDVIYFGSDGGTILKEHLAEQVGMKEFGKASDYLICHCFNFRRSDVQSELDRSGDTTIAQQIGSYIKQKLCACETLNPTGQCCLGFVNKVVKDAKLKK